MASLLQLSHELLHCIFIEVDPYDIPNLRLSCKDIDRYINGNRLLHQCIYQRRWDTPSTAVDWESEVHNSVKLNKILDSADANVKEANLTFVAGQIERLLNTASTQSEDSLNVKFLAERFDNAANVDAFLTSSSLFARAGTHPHRPVLQKALQQTSAKLHCLYGFPITEFSSKTQLNDSPAAGTRQQTKAHQIHQYARSKVYDLREYTDDTLWGPFMNDGSQNVDWEKVEAILVDLAYNTRRCYENARCCMPLQCNARFEGVTPNSFVEKLPEATAEEDEKMDEKSIKLRELALQLDQQDPYGVTGTWLRVVCFLDYSELYHFNFNFEDNMRIDPSIARPPLDSPEGMLGVAECWRVVKIEPPGSHDDDEEEAGMDWSNFTGTRLPIVHFAGISQSLQFRHDTDANSRIRGTVRQTPEGEIRWTTFSIFHGEERWRSESVQIGGLRSGRGVVGNWFDKDYSDTGPAGPTAFWKQSDKMGVSKALLTHLANR
ncbi:hypothetical protein AMS68_005271 [Peltaster fructicola]|uniref:Uncharacterized protein n=1 Tax=Peltaster fructicola TaxID=286661 RepID=A0A6H0XYD7_9PEZI|nr:hypothetical protein AMS68_005271 [Peltaster fructicola]